MKRCICADQDHFETPYTKTLLQPPPAKHPSKCLAGTKREFEISCTESRSNFNTVDFVPAPLFKHFNRGNLNTNENSTLGYQFLVDHNVPSYTLRPYGNSFTPLPVTPSSSPGTEHTATLEPSEAFIFFKNYKNFLYYSN